MAGEADLSDDSGSCPCEDRSAPPPPKVLRPKMKKKLSRILKSVEKELVGAWSKGKDLDFIVKEMS